MKIPALGELAQRNFDFAVAAYMLLRHHAVSGKSQQDVWIAAQACWEVFIQRLYYVKRLQPEEALLEAVHTIVEISCKKRIEDGLPEFPAADSQVWRSLYVLSHGKGGITKEIRQFANKNRNRWPGAHKD